MALFLHERTVRNKSCDSCGEAFQHVTGFVNDERGAYAVYFAACHAHPEHVAQIDVVLGSWGAEPPIDDHVTFSCWQRAEGATAVDAPVATSSEPLLRECLTREEALAHRKVAEFWAVVDLLTEFDPTVYEAVYGGPPESLGRAVLRTLRRRLGV